MDEAEKAAALHVVPLFSEVGKRDLNRIARCAVERHYDPGDEIVGENERGVAMFVVVNGSVEATKEGADGPIHLTDLGPGAYFGELALFENFPRSATIRAKTATDCLALTEWDFKAELRSEPAIALQMLKTTMRRLRDTTARLAELEGSAAAGPTE
ncbi:MAG: cyclic nucleotide-binding domain-containing protein [Dehalococcoidia bacterium]